MSEKTVKQQATEECHIHGMEEKRQTDFITSIKRKAVSQNVLSTKGEYWLSCVIKR